MVCIRLDGGLGNQLFEYAFACSLADLNKDSICLDKSGISNETHNVYSLHHFNIKVNAEEITKNTILSFSQLSLIRLISFFRLVFRKFYGKRGMYAFEKIIQKTINRMGIYLCKDGYVNFFRANKKIKNKYAEGYFQSEKYFKNVEERIRSEFKVIDEPLKENLQLLSDIKNTNSVCVHIRRGDYTLYTNFLVCTPKYYKEGMRLIKEKYPDAKFFIFSDDINWVKENIKFDYDVTFSENNNPNYEELRLMYSCKHFVISNSSFSWWAQYLSDNLNKTVVAPSRWFNDKNQVTDIFQDDWIRIEV